LLDELIWCCCAWCGNTCTSFWRPVWCKWPALLCVKGPLDIVLCNFTAITTRHECSKLKLKKPCFVELVYHWRCDHIGVFELPIIAVMMYGWAKVVFSWFTNDEKLCNIFSISYNSIDTELITMCLKKQSKGKNFKCIIKFVDIQFADLWNQFFVLFGWKLTMAHVVVYGW